MEIEAVHCNAINGDGTLLLKVDVDEPEKPFQYCFYIYKGSETLFKSAYKPESWLEYKAEEFGKYQIKAFVRDRETKAAVSRVVPYVLKEKYAWKLAESKKKEPPITGMLGVELERISPGVFRAGTALTCRRYAWRVFQEGKETPEFSRDFSPDPVLVYAALHSGCYRVELTAELENERLQGLSPWMEMKREELDGDRG